MWKPGKTCHICLVDLLFGVIVSSSFSVSNYTHPQVEDLSDIHFHRVCRKEDTQASAAPTGCGRRWGDWWWW